MNKKILTVIFLILISFIVSSCSKNSKDLKAIKQAQTTLINSSSGKIIATSVQTTNGQDIEKYTLEATYMISEKGIIKYCATQADTSGKVVSVEYNDGEVLDRWIVGMGWKSVDPVSDDFIVYNRKKPFPVLDLMIQPIDEKGVEKISRASTDSVISYSLNLNIKNQKDDMKAQGYNESELSELLESTKNVLIDSNNTLCACTDTVKVKDVQTGDEITSVIDAQVSELNKIKEIVKPDMRNY